MQGERMRELRQGLRLSQAALKDELNRRLGRSYDNPKISRWENGREPVPDDVADELLALSTGSPRKARVIALANQKGGVGKTTSTHLIWPMLWQIVATACYWLILILRLLLLWHCSLVRQSRHTVRAKRWRTLSCMVGRFARSWCPSTR